MQPFNLALGSAIAIAGVEGPRRLIEELLLPGVNLIGMDLIALGEIGHRRVLPQRLQCNLRLQRRVDLPSCSLRHSPLRRLPTERPEIQLVNRSQIRGPLQKERKLKREIQ